MIKYSALLLVLVSTLSLAQGGLQDQYHFNYLAINPAFTGERGNFGFVAQLGNQFNGSFTPNQVSQIFAIDGKLGEGKSAMGFQGFRINQGGFINSGLNVNYAFAIQNDNYSLRLGTDLGIYILPNFVNNVDILNRFTTFIGLGGLLQFKKAFISISNPTLITPRKNLYLSENYTSLIVGYALNIQENVRLNLSGLAALPTEGSIPKKLHLNAKLWLSDKFGLGASYRINSSTSILSSNSKIIPTLEYKIATGSRLGLSYDSSPLSGLTSDPQFYNNNGIFQLLYRYDLIQDGQKTPITNNF